jgi:prepilin-type processing-associated H-X9-DG protein
MGMREAHAFFVVPSGGLRRSAFVENESINNTFLKGSEMYCSKCGVQNSDGVTQCANCGSVLAEPSQPAAVEGVPMAIEPKTCGLAIAAFVMGLLSLTCVLWPFLALPAIICGIIALVKIGGSQGRLKGTGLAVAGLVIPAVLTLILPMLLAILMPAFSSAKHAAQRVVCATNMKGLSTAMIVYMNDYDDQYPTPEQWCDLLIEKAGVSPKSFQCPLDPEGAFSYAINENLYKVKSDMFSAQMVAIFEADLGRNGVGGLDDVVLRHDQHGRLGCNIGFVDGHTEFVTEDHIAGLQWTVE